MSGSQSPSSPERPVTSPPNPSPSARSLGEIDAEISDVCQKFKLLWKERKALTGDRENSLADKIIVDFTTTKYPAFSLDTMGLKGLILPSLETFEWKYTWYSMTKLDFVDVVGFLNRHHYSNLKFSLIIDPSTLSHCSKAGPVSLFSAIRHFAHRITGLVMNLDGNTNKELSREDKEHLRSFLHQLGGDPDIPEETLKFPNLETLMFSFLSVDYFELEWNMLLKVVSLLQPKVLIINTKKVPTNLESWSRFKNGALQYLNLNENGMDAVTLRHPISGSLVSSSAQEPIDELSVSLKGHYEGLHKPSERLTLNPKHRFFP